MSVSPLGRYARSTTSSRRGHFEAVWHFAGARTLTALLDINCGSELILKGRRFTLTSQQMSAIYQQGTKTTQLIMLIN